MARFNNKEIIRAEKEEIYGKYVKMLGYIESLEIEYEDEDCENHAEILKQINAEEKKAERYYHKYGAVIQEQMNKDPINKHVEW